MHSRRAMPNHALGTHTENTVDALKKRLGVDRLSLVVVDSLEEYRELLVEMPPTRERQLWITLLLISLGLAVFVLFAGEDIFWNVLPGL